MNIIDFVENNDFEKTKEEIEKGNNINVIDKYGYSLLHVASSKNYTSIAKLLIESGINLNLCDKNRQTILHYAAQYNQLDIAKLALEKGANINQEDIYGNQALWTAVFNDKGKNERIEIIKLFLDYNANVNHKNNVNKSPKDIVIIAGYNNLLNIVS